MAERITPEVVEGALMRCDQLASLLARGQCTTPASVGRELQRNLALVENGVKALAAERARVEVLEGALREAVDDLLHTNTGVFERSGGWECSDEELVGDYRAALAQTQEPRDV